MQQHYPKTNHVVASTHKRTREPTADKNRRLVLKCHLRTFSFLAHSINSLSFN